MVHESGSGNPQPDEPGQAESNQAETNSEVEADSPEAERIGLFFELLELQLDDIGNEVGSEIDPEILFGEDRKIGHYAIKEFVNFGGQAYVFSAFDEKLNRNVVLKVYRPSFHESVGEKALTEARNLVQVQSDHVARCYDFDTANEVPFLVLEPVVGENLLAIESQGVGVSRALEIAIQIAQGVAAIHDKGFLHLDLKPDNVIVQNNEQVKIVDFGLSRAISDSHIGPVSGAPSFMPPEIANQQPHLVGPRTDIFGIGAVLYFLVCGQPPYAAERKTEVVSLAMAGKSLPVRSVNPSVSRALDGLIAKCLDKNVSKRFASADSLLLELKRLKKIRSQSKQLLFGGSVLSALLLLFVIFGVPKLFSPNRNTEGLASRNAGSPVVEALGNSEQDKQSILQWFEELQHSATPVFNRGDLELRLEGVEILDDDGSWKPKKPDNGVFVFVPDQRIRFTFQSPKACFPAGFCFNATTKTTDLDEVVRFMPSEGSLLQVNANQPIVQEFVAVKTPANTTEFLYLRAATFDWKIPKLETVIESQDFRKKLRGLKPVKSTGATEQAELLIPFRVVSN